MAWMATALRHTDTVMQTVTIPAGATAATLTLFLHIDSAETSTTTAFGYANRSRYEIPRHGTLQPWQLYSNLNQAAGINRKTFNLLRFKGQTIQILFTGVEDFNAANILRPGRR